MKMKTKSFLQMAIFDWICKANDVAIGGKHFKSQFCSLFFRPTVVLYHLLICSKNFWSVLSVNQRDMNFSHDIPKENGVQSSTTHTFRITVFGWDEFDNHFHQLRAVQNFIHIISVTNPTQQMNFVHHQLILFFPTVYFAFY